jgi:hypothetical protein
VLDGPSPRGSFMIRILRTPIFFVVLFSILLAGCGGRDGAAPSPAPPEASLDACVLLLRQDLDPEGELGLRKIRTAIDQTEGPRYAKCAWGVPRSDIFASLEVRRMESPERALAAQSGGLPVLRRLAGVALVDVPGLGDTATWAGGRLDQLHVVDRQFRLILTLEIGPEAGRRELAGAIGARVLERLRILDVVAGKGAEGSGR